MLSITRFYLILTFCLALPLTAGRLHLFLRYSHVFEGAPMADIVGAFIWGIRFDLFALAATAGLPALMMFLPVLNRGKYFFRSAVLLLFAIEAVALGYLFVDVLYFDFSQRHLSFELQNTTGDLDVILRIGFREYLMESLGFLAALVAYLFWLLRVIRKQRIRVRGGALSFTQRPGFLAEAGAFIIIMAMTLIFLRGGIQSKPIDINDAFMNQSTEMGVLTLNGIFTTLESYSDTQKHGSGADYLNSIETPDVAIANLIMAPGRESAHEPYPLYRRYDYGRNEFRPLNVVVLIMESWGSKYVGAQGAKLSATPNFDRLSRDGLLMNNCFANAQRSIEGLPSIMASLPSFKGVAFSYGGMLFQSRMRTMGNVLSSLGYETVFAHGAPAASMGFDGVASKMGYSRHLSMDHFMKGRESHDGIWGIYDQYVFGSMPLELANLKKPFLSVIYSLSSHSPYSLPPGGESRFKEEDSPHWRFLNSMLYTDKALGLFFDGARKEDFFKNTLFVITADHTEGRSTSEDLYELYRVPCLLYAPGVEGLISPGVIRRPVSQMDIAPTVLDLMRSSEPYTAMGLSMLEPSEGRALLPYGEMFAYVRGAYMLHASVDRPRALFEYERDPKLDLLKDGGREGEGYAALARDMHQEMLAYMKFYYDAVSSNSLAPPPGED